MPPMIRLLSSNLRASINRLTSSFGALICSLWILAFSFQSGLLQEPARFGWFRPLTEAPALLEARRISYARHLAEEAKTGDGKARGRGASITQRNCFL